MVTTTILRLKINYAPLPEENTMRGNSSSSSSPAALEYCQRAARLFLSDLEEKEGDHHHDRNIIMKRELVGIEPLPDDASRLFDTTTTCDQKDDSNCIETKESSVEKATTTRNLHLFIVSCAADGSVHRSVRKFARSLANIKLEKHDDDISFALTLLGHARCDNSAKQMADTIYSAGYRLEKSLLQTLSGSSSSTMTTTIAEQCETQVELEGPEVKFDPWFMTLLAAQSSLS